MPPEGFAVGASLGAQGLLPERMLWMPVTFRRPGARPTMAMVSSLSPHMGGLRLVRVA